MPKDKPVRLSTEIRIAAPRQRVWQVLTEYAEYATWNPYLVCVEGEARAGTEIIVHSVNRPGMDPVAAPVLVLAVEPFTMRWEGGLPDRSLFKGDHWFELVGDGGTTVLHHYEDFTGSKAAELIAVYREIILDNFRKFNFALKAVTEA
jgi:hypothetical protein